MKISKSDFISIIKKFHLNGLLEKVKFNVKDGNLFIDQKPDDGSFRVTLNANLPIPDGTFGIGTPNELISLLSALSDEFDVSYHFVKNKAVGLNLSDDKATITYVYLDESVVQSETKVPQELDWDLTIDLTKDFMTKVIQLKKALSNPKCLAISPMGDKVDWIMNYDPTSNVNYINLAGTATICKTTQIHGFDANLIASIFEANKDFRTATLKISDEQIAWFTFMGEDCEVVYRMRTLNF